MDLDKKFKVSQLFYYPLKSGHEIQSNEVRITESGAVNDRIFVILDKKTNKFFNLKANKNVYKIKVSFKGEIAVVQIPNNEMTYEIDVEYEKKNLDSSRIIEVSIYNINCKGLVMREDINKALSQYFGMEVLLVYAISQRYMKDDKKNSLLLENHDQQRDKTFFADLAPFLLTSEESLDDLNQKLKIQNIEKVNSIGFRPNIVIRGGGTAYFEDKVNKFKIGNVIFRRVKGCVRCKMITFDPEKNDFRSDKEPLETLYDGRVDERLGGPIFGQNLCCDIQGDSEAVIKVGDEVTVLEWAS
jgi:uncharacterized protein YcbX